MPNKKYWTSQIAASRAERDKRLPVWKDNVRFRLGRPFGDDTLREQSLVSVPIDASFTKAKIASLFSQVPAVSVTPKNNYWAQAAAAFAKELNETLQNEAKVDRTMEECLADVVNAAGIAAAKVGYQATFEAVEVPAEDISMYPPEIGLQLLQSGAIEMEKVQRTVDERFYAQRISPSNLLWPADFKGSDFDEASWIGWESQVTIGQAKREFGLTPSQIDEVKGAGKLETLSDDDHEGSDDEKRVTFTEIFYRPADYDADTLYFSKIRRIVFIEGLKDPVVDEDLQWQKFNEQSNTYVGVCKYPIRVLTLTYISDECVPPSDSEVGRPQVLELMRTRAQIIQQRDHSKPIRWVDTNRVDPQIMDLLQRGEWQHFIPTQGTGERAIGEVARANYPAENWDFERVIRNDLQEGWQLGANQTGQFASGERSASEAQIVQNNFNTRVGFERAKVGKFFVGIAEVMAGLIQLYKDRPEELIGGQQSQQAIAAMPVDVEYALSIKPDSTVLLEASAKIERLMKTLNLIGKSGFVNAEPIIAEILTLSGLDPSEVMVKPKPPAPEPPNVSYRFSGVEDLQNPLAVALLQKSTPVTPEEIAAAKLLIQDAAMPTQPVAPPAAPVSGVPGEPVPANPVGRPPVAATGQLPPIVNPPSPDWGPMERITKRVDEMGG